MVKLFGLLLCLLLFSSCGILPIEGRYFGTKDSSIQHLGSKKTEFQQVVERWQKINPDGEFSYRVADNRSVTWNDITLMPQKNSYKVSNGGQIIVTNASFQQACEIAKVPEEELRWWIAQAEALKIFSICVVGTKLPAEERHVEIALRGSDLKAYGLIYVPDGHDKAFNLFLYQARMKQPPLIYTRLDYVEGRWFYFEEK